MGSVYDEDEDRAIEAHAAACLERYRAEGGGMSTLDRQVSLQGRYAAMSGLRARVLRVAARLAPWVVLRWRLGLFWWQR